MARGDDGDRDTDALKSDGQAQSFSDGFPGSVVGSGKGDRARIIPSSPVGDPNAPLRSDGQTNSRSDGFPGSIVGPGPKAGSSAGIPNPDIIGRGYGDTNVAPPGSTRKTTEGTAAYSSGGGALKDSKPAG